jgi:hypothetical protein
MKYQNYTVLVALRICLEPLPESVLQKFVNIIYETQARRRQLCLLG